MIINKLYVIGYYKDDGSSEAVTLLTGNDENIWWKAQCWMGEMLGIECDWTFEINTIDDAIYWTDKTEQEKYQC